MPQICNKSVTGKQLNSIKVSLLELLIFLIFYVSQLQSFDTFKCFMPQT